MVTDCFKFGARLWLIDNFGFLVQKGGKRKFKEFFSFDEIIFKQINKQEFLRRIERKLVIVEE